MLLQRQRWWNYQQEHHLSSSPVSGPFQIMSNGTIIQEDLFRYRDPINESFVYIYGFYKCTSIECNITLLLGHIGS